jgi:chromodomain-helicase-DNA-binding protein 1
MGAKGLKKIENFMKKAHEIALWKRNSNADDVEYMECQMEMEQELTNSYTTVERIVDRQMPDGDAEYPDYYVKWRNLPYSEATWESGKLIEEENSEAIRQFKMREESRYTPSKSNRVLKHRLVYILFYQSTLTASPWANFGLNLDFLFRQSQNCPT